jgi:type II secretion system protein G
MIKKGFTLIEMLVVIGIIAVLAGLIMPSLGTSQMKARDAKRKSDLKQIQKALEIYRQDQDPVAFPADGSFLNLSTSWASGATVYMSTVPSDPDSTSATRVNYSYVVDNTTLTYLLCTCLENTIDPAPACAANGTLNCPACVATKKCYGITQP